MSSPAATAGLRRMIQDLDALGHRAAGSGQLLASGRPLTNGPLGGEEEHF